MAKRTNLSLMAAAVMVVLIGAGLAQADPNLVAHWKLDGDANDSAGSNDGTIHGAIPTTGKIGGALDFDGVNDKINCGDILDNEIRNAFTIGVWIKLGEGALQKSLNYVLWKSDDRPGIRVHSDGKVAFLLWHAGPGSGFHSSHVLEEEKWYYISYVFDGSEFIGYINAEFTGTTPDIGYSPGGSLRIAGDADSNRYFKGVIDDVRIYNRALTAGEIGQLYGAELIGLEIVGPGEVAEDSQVQYKAIGAYDNNSTADITGSVEWSVGPNDIADVNAGLLTMEMVDLPIDVVITAEYTDGNTVEAEKEVSILPICPSGSALEFDGVDDYVNCGNDSSFDVAEQITLTAWIKPDHLPIEGFILGKWGVSNISYGFRVNSANPRIFIARTSSQYEAKTYTDLSLSADSWNHIAVTWDGNAMKGYLNGQVSGQELVFAGPINVSSEPVAIGYNAGYGGGAGGTYFDGIIDEVAIWDRALSAGEIQGFMHIRPDSNEPNLVAYWDFDEGSGQEAGDSSGNGNDGQLGAADTPDGSDPNWVDDIPPIGICGVEGIVERNLLNVLGMKSDVLDILDAAMGKEEALWEYMDMVFKDRDFGTASKGDVVKAKQRIMGAIQQEEQAGTAVDKSIEKLDDAMDTLGIESDGE